MSRKSGMNKPPPSRGRMSGADRRQRDAIIAQRVAQDWTWKAIATEAGMSERNARDRYALWREHNAGVLSRDATKLLEHLVEGMFAGIGDLEAMAVDADNDSAALGAKKAAMETREKCIRILQELGKLPKSMTGVRDLLEARALGEMLWGTFADAREQELSVKDAEALFRERLGQYLGDGEPDEPPGPALDSSDPRSE